MTTNMRRADNQWNDTLFPITRNTMTNIREEFTALLAHLKDIERIACLGLDTDDARSFDLVEDFRTDLSELVMKADYIQTQL